jgi:hypothetical protein
MQGYVLGDPTTVPHDDYNSRIPFAHRKTLISDELYEVTSDPIDPLVLLVLEYHFITKRWILISWVFYFVYT